MAKLRQLRRWVLVLLGLLVGASFLLPIAGAAPRGDETDEGDAGGEETEANEFVIGRLTDKKGNADRADDEPVEGVTITVVAENGDEIAVVQTDAEGEFEVPLPGPGAYEVTLDPESLPEGVGLAEGTKTRAVTVENRERQRVLFSLGGRTRDVATRLERFWQLLANGTRFGLIIAITSVGLSLIFGTTGLTNFAHGELVTFGAIVAWYINVDWGLQLIPAAMLAMVVGGLFGGALDAGLWRRLRKRKLSLLSMMIVSIGLSLLLRNILLYWFGGGGRFYGDYLRQRVIDIGPIAMTPRDLWSIAISLVVLVGVALMLQRTRFGKATRAVADNPELAASSGIDVDQVILIVWMVGSALAALGGVLFALSEQVNFKFGFELLLLMFAGVTLGGLGTAYGALLGSFIIGVFVNVSTLWIRPDLKNVGALVILIVILLVRPQGVLGRAERVG